MIQSETTNIIKAEGVEVTLYRLVIRDGNEVANISYGLLIKTSKGRDAVPVGEHQTDNLERILK